MFDYPPTRRLSAATSTYRRALSRVRSGREGHGSTTAVEDPEMGIGVAEKLEMGGEAALFQHPVGIATDGE